MASPCFQNFTSQLAGVSVSGLASRNIPPQAIRQRHRRNRGLVQNQTGGSGGHGVNSIECFD
jgi:hypothetical protein